MTTKTETHIEIVVTSEGATAYSNGEVVAGFWFSDRSLASYTAQLESFGLSWEVVRRCAKCGEGLDVSAAAGFDTCLGCSVSFR